MEPFVFCKTELMLIEPRSTASRNVMAARRAFVGLALRLVVEDGGEISGERHSSSFFDTAVVEELIEQCSASFVNHALR
jgi:hypothetical protein